MSVTVEAKQNSKKFARISLASLVGFGVGFGIGQCAQVLANKQLTSCGASVRYPPFERHLKPPSGGFFRAPKSFWFNDLRCFQNLRPSVWVEASFGFGVGFGVGLCGISFCVDS